MDDCSVFSSRDHDHIVRGDGDGERFWLPTTIKDFDDSKKDFLKKAKAKSTKKRIRSEVTGRIAAS